MYSQKEVYEMNFENATGCFFNDKNIDFEKILDFACDEKLIGNLDFIALEKVPDLWEKELLKYQEITMIPDEKIQILINGLQTRSHKLKAKKHLMIKRWLTLFNMIFFNNTIISFRSD